MSETNPTAPTNDDPKNQQDPAHPVSHDQDSEPTMNAPDGERPDGLATGDSSTGGDGSPS